MKKYYQILKLNTLFNNFSDDDIDQILKFLDAHIVKFAKNQIIRHADRIVKEAGIIVVGNVYLTKYNVEGNRIILSELPVGSIFGESLSLVNAKESPVLVVSATPATIVFLSAEKMVQMCTTESPFQKQFVKNLITQLAQKNLLLQIKNDILSQKTTREKLLLYFEYQSKTAKSNSFKIHFSREELADFLSLNSSAVSRELGKLRDEGLLTFNKNTFTLKNSDD